MEVTLKIRRSPDGASHTTETYTVEVPETATLLDALDAVKDKRDGTLAYRKSCRMAVCGSCGMRMDGGAVLACKTAMKPLVEAGHVPTISPMGNLPVIKDLVVDMEPFWAKIRAVKPFLQTEAHPAKEHLVEAQVQQANIGKEALCIMCGCCVSECNSMESDPDFLGPAALAKAQRFVGDQREDDVARRSRLKDLNGAHGIWDCTRCYFCNQRCPKGVDPRDAIAKLGAQTFRFGSGSEFGAKTNMFAPVAVAGVADEALRLGERRRAEEVGVGLHRVALGDAAAALDAERLLHDPVELLLLDAPLLDRRAVVLLEPRLHSLELGPEGIHVDDQVLDHRQVAHRRDDRDAALLRERRHRRLARQDGGPVHPHSAGAAHGHAAALAIGDRAIDRVLDDVEDVEERRRLGSVDRELLQPALVGVRVVALDLEGELHAAPVSRCGRRARTR